MLPLGGDGTPEVSEFCPAEVGAELAISTNSAAILIGNALDLRHRLPQLWARIQAGEVKPWIGRQIATDTRDVSLETVTVVDRRVAKYAHSLTWGRLAKVVQAAIIDTDPDYARQREESHRRNRGVWLNPADETGTITGAFAAAGPDALTFDAGLNRTADALAALGDSDTKESADPKPSASSPTPNSPWTSTPPPPCRRSSLSRPRRDARSPSRVGTRHRSCAESASRSTPDPKPSSTST